MAGKAEVTAGPVFARVRVAGEVFMDLAEVAVENGCAIQVDFHGGAFDGDLFIIPLADGVLISALRGDHAVSGAVGLAGVDFVAGGFFVIVIEHLAFAHADVSGIAVTGVANGEAVIAAGGQLEFEASDEIAVNVGIINGAAFAGPAHHGAIFHLVFIDGAGPAGEILAIKDGFKAGGVLGAEAAVGFVGADFADEEAAPADFPAMGLELERAFGWNGQVAVVIIFEHSAIDGLFAVEPDPDTGADHDDVKMVPFAERFIGFDERVLSGRAGAIVPESAGAFISTEVELVLFGGIPDLDLGTAAQVNAAIGEGNGLVIDEQFEIAVELVGGEVETFAVVDEFVVFGMPMLADIVEAGVVFGFEIFGGEGFVFARVFGIGAPPAGEVVAVEQGGESGGHFGGGMGVFMAAAAGQNQGAGQGGYPERIACHSVGLKERGVGGNTENSRTVEG